MRRYTKGVCKASAAKCVEPVMRGFYAAGLKKNAVPRKAQLAGAAAKPAAAAAAERSSDADAAIEATAGSLGVSSVVADGSGIPAHIRATAHGIPGEFGAAAAAAAAAAAGTFGVPFGVPGVEVYGAAAAVFAAVLVFAALAVVLRRRRRTATVGNAG